MDSLPAISLGRLEKNLEDWDSSSTFNQASFDNQLKGFLLTCMAAVYRRISLRNDHSLAIVVAETR